MNSQFFGVLALVLAMPTEGRSISSAPVQGASTLNTLVAVPPKAPTIPFFQGDDLPLPPMQEAPWSPNTNGIDATLLTATRTLFDQGLPDPRNCEYRSMEIKVGNVWGRNNIVRVHGWIIPKKDQANEGRFAIAWNGAIYPVISIGDTASIQADIVALIKADEDMRAKAAQSNANSPFYRFRSAMPEASSASEGVLLPLKACLLLRLGEYELSQQLWSAWTGGMRENTNDDATHLRDPYLMLAIDWVWAVFDRAVCAHMTGDDKLSLLDCKSLEKIGPLIEAESKRRNFPTRDFSLPPQDRKFVYLDFLTPLPQLLQDEARRVEESKHEKGTSTGTTKDVASLIENLDEIDARQWGQPGGVSLGRDEKVEALIAAGDAAVEPLLEAFENDTRLTRSVQFGRDFHHGRSFITVASAAYVALTGVLKTSQFRESSIGEDVMPTTAPSRHEVAEQIRAYWKKYGGVSQEERWYRVLQDDRAGRAAWLETASNIVRPRNVRVVPPSNAWTETVMVPPKPGEVPPMAGEALRSKQNPSVTQLLELRASQVGAASAQSSYDTIIKRDACDIALALAKWEPTASLPALKLAAGRFEQTIMKSGSDYGSGETYMLRLLLARAKAGDSSALQDYSRWIKAGKSESPVFVDADLFATFWMAPSTPALEDVGEFLFNNSQSPWKKRWEQAHEVSDLFETPLWRLPSVKRHLLQKLQDQSHFGSVALRQPEPEKGLQELQVSAGGTGFYRTVEPDPLKPKIGTTSEFRICDFYAWMLWDQRKQIPKAPRFELYWPLAKRNQALRNSINFMKMAKRTAPMVENRGSSLPR